MENLLAKKIKENFSNDVKELVYRKDLDCLIINQSAVIEVVKFIKNTLEYKMLLDIVALDFKGKKEHRYQLDYLFYNMNTKKRILLQVPLDDDENPKIESLISVFRNSDWAERECYDMMGIEFLGHPNLKRLLMWDEFEGHPLRKDYPLAKRQNLPVLAENLGTIKESAQDVLNQCK